MYTLSIESSYHRRTSALTGTERTTNHHPETPAEVSGRTLWFVSRGVHLAAAFGRPPPTKESYRDGPPMSNLCSRMTISAFN